MKSPQRRLVLRAVWNVKRAIGNEEDDDHNPPRITPHNLFDASLGENNILRKERYKVDLDLAAINFTDE